MADERHPLTIPFATASALACLQTLLGFHLPDVTALGLGMGLAYAYCRWALQRPAPPSASAPTHALVNGIAVLIGLYLVLGFGWSMLLLLAIASAAFKSEWVWNLLKELAQSLTSPNDPARTEAIAPMPSHPERTSEPIMEAPEPPAPPETLEAVVAEAPPAEPASTEPVLPTSSLDGWGLESTLSASASTPSAWDGLSSSNSGFDEALAMLQGRKVEESPKSPG